MTVTTSRFAAVLFTGALVAGSVPAFAQTATGNSPATTQTPAASTPSTGTGMSSGMTRHTTAKHRRTTHHAAKKTTSSSAG